LIFDIALKPGGTFKKLERFSTEIALALKSISEPLIYPVTSEGIVRMEVMVSSLDTVNFKDIIDSKEFSDSDCILPVAFGRLRNGSPLIVDLTKMPHLLVSGATGSGKSILLQTIINSLLLKSTNYNLALIDTKRVEFSYYDGLLKLYGPIARDVDSANILLNNLIIEMENRFKVLEKSGCRDITYYKGFMPYIVVVVDEFADLMVVSRKESQELICRLAQKSRACGIHLVVATQRPSVDVVTGLIKANFPSRISCQVSSSSDSRIVLDKNGAEKLSGKGDAIIDCPGFNFKRFKGSYLTEEEIVYNVKNTRSWWSKLWNS
jgi:S-DNA-T family DNA segregation ATPase FtsK/SpoIIIE